MTFKEKCMQAGINYDTAKAYRLNHKNLTDEQIIEYYLTPKEKTFKQKCKEANVSYNSATKYRKNHPELTDEKVIEHCINHRTFAEKCRQAGINYDLALAFRARNNNLTDEQVIEACTKRKARDFKVKCNKVHVPYAKVVSYKHYHKINDNEAIVHFRPDIRLNIFGEIILPNGEILK